MLTRSLFSRSPFGAEMDRLFDSVMTYGPRVRGDVAGRAAHPAVNLFEDDANVYVEAELPGLRLEDLELVFTDGVLTLKGTRPAATGENVLQRERPEGAFERPVAIPFDVDAESISATLRHGILTVTMPKAPASRPQRIEVRGTE